jgi:NADH:ubiquinone oxidoreductase subunit 4 (subunit M)
MLLKSMYSLERRYLLSYSTYLYSRLIGGNLTLRICNYYDLIFYEFIISFILILSIILLGLIPNLVLDLLTVSHFLLLEKFKF